MALRFPVAVVVCGVLLAAGLAQAQDHEKCYKIKDPLKLSANVDLTSALTGLEAGCLVSKAKYFCVPASKTVNSATDKITGLPIVPLPIYSAPAPGDRICYKIKCPTSVIADQFVTDQFGGRTFLGTSFKASYLCTPAVEGAWFCGNGAIDPGEACDAPALGGCPGTCESDCTCTCPTACCYVENPPTPAPSPPDVNCFEYSGTPAQTAAFALACIGPGITGFQIKTGVPAPCGAAPSPIFGLPCFAAPNLVIVPPDSTCP